MSNEVETNLDEMKEIIDEFLIEADELIHALDTDLVKLESTPNDLDLLNSIFRAAHTIKGTSSFLGFEQITSLTHQMEDILNRLRKAEMVVTPAIMDVLLESVDVLKVLLENVRNHVTEEIDLTDISHRLTIALSSPEETAAEAVTAGSSGTRPAAGENPAHISASTTADGKTAPASRRQVIDTKGDQTIRVDIGRLDQLMNLMGELVLGRNALVQSLGKLNSDNSGQGEGNVENINRASAAVSYITTELQLAVTKMRMQPIGKVFGKFPRLVRDLARDSGKEIDLVISGESTELDKSVIEEIGDPLVHILRNSCDHGIESPADRKAKGKPGRGTIRLNAFPEGSNIVIRIEDDGKGFDVVAIRDKAVERGLISRAEVDKMSDREVFKYIFEAGFSTAKIVTDVSGRGVGMDVVRTNIEKLNGVIELDSAKDIGTSITIKLPLTLAIMQGLLVQSDDEIFILPLSSVHETVRPVPTDISYVNKKPVLRLRDEIIPIINLNRIIRGDNRGFVMAEKPYIVVVGLADQKLGINIDRFLGQEEAVIKSLGTYLGSTEGVAGATILGDGRIRLIIDLMGLFNLARKLR